MPLVLLGLVAGAFNPVPAPAQRRMASMVRRAFDYNAIEVGFIGGANRSTATGAGPIAPRVRGSLGGFLSLRLGDGFRFRPELLMSVKAVATETDLIPPCLPPGPCPGPFRQTETTSATWLEAPMLLEYRFRGPGRGGLVPKLYGGPFLAIRMSCSIATAVEMSPSRVVRSCAEPSQGFGSYNNGDAGFVVGGGVATRGVGIGLRWTRSLAEVAPFQAAGGSRLIGAKLSVLAATVEFSTRLW